MVPQVRPLSTLPTGSPYEVYWALVPWRPLSAISLVLLGLPAAMLVRGQARPTPWTVAALVVVAILLVLLLVRLPQRTGRGIRLAADLTGVWIVVGPRPERFVYAPWEAVHLVMFTEAASPQPFWLPWTRPITLIRIVLPTTPPDVCEALRAGGLLLEESTARPDRRVVVGIDLRHCDYDPAPIRHYHSAGSDNSRARARRAQERLRELALGRAQVVVVEPAAPIWLD